MQILKRAKNSELEILSTSESESNVKEEANRRATKAGYCTREGNPIYRTKIQNRGYGESKIKVWPRDENGNLIGD